MTFRLASDGGECADCNWIAAEGDIELNTPAVFKKFLATHDVPRGTLVRLDSPGGIVHSAIELGTLFREGGFRTDVGKTLFAPDGGEASDLAVHGKGACASACAYAFAGGAVRTLASGSRIGVHQFYSGEDARGSDQSAQWAIAGLGLYLSEMDISNDLLVLAAATPPFTMRWLDRPTLEETGMVTDRRAPPEADWQVVLAEADVLLKSAQVQKNGSVTEFSLSCSATQPGTFRLIAHRRLAAGSEPGGQALGSSLKRVSIQGADRVTLVAALEVDAVEVAGETLDISADIGRQVLKRLASRAGEEAYLDLDAPDELTGVAGGRSHRLPLKNLAAGAQVLERNCAG